MTVKSLQWLFVLVSFLLVAGLTDSRSIETKEEKSELSKASMTSMNDDVDLETFLEDYYDDLWLYLEAWGKDLGKIKKKKDEEKEKGKSVPIDYDYMSDMPANQEEVDGKKFKSLEKDPAEEGKENFTISDFGAADRNEDERIDIIRANRESNSQEEYPLRSKQMRLKSIIDQVLSFRGGSPKLNETLPDVKQYNALRELYEKNIKKIESEDWTSSYTEKVQSFYSSCDIPRNTDEDVWSDPYSMNLFFDLEYPAPQEDSTVMIVTAKLRLFKLPQENVLPSNTETSTPKVKWEKSQTSYGVLPVDDDRLIRISVYWYTRSLRRHRVKKKLLDSQMLPLNEGKWTEFNIRPAVRTWKDSGKNFGLVVNVEDEDGTLLPAEQYIQSMNCSKWTATVRPIPSIIIDRMNQYLIDSSQGKNDTRDEAKYEDDKHKENPYQPFLYPIIDLRTREVPNSDVRSIALVNSAKKALETKYLDLQRKGFNVTNDNIGSFLKKNNMDLAEITKLSRVDKSIPSKQETGNGEIRVSYFQNVPIGSPSRGIPEEAEPKEQKDKDKEEERVMPRIRHNRRQWDVSQKATNSYSEPRSDFNATDHH